MSCIARVKMNEFLAQKLNKSKHDSIPLTDDMEVLERTPVKVSSPRPNKLKVFSFSRRLFSKNNKSFRMHKRSPPALKSKVSRIRSLFNEFQNKLQSWSQELKGNMNEHKPSNNCVTPNRRIRYMLGRTPEKLYSPFGIETPPSHFKKYSSSDLMEYPFSAFHEWLTPPKHKHHKESKVATHLFD